MMRQLRCGLFSLCAVWLLFAGRCEAVDLDWTGTGPLLFYDTPTNWTPNSAVGGPTSVDNVTFAIDVAGSPIIIGAMSDAQDVNVTDNDWEFTGAAGGVLTSTGVTTIDDPLGTSLVDGTNLVASNNLQWSTAANLIVGESGFGSLTVQGGSDLDALQVFVGDGANAVGELTLTGDNTSLTARFISNTGVHVIGRGGGTGTVNVEAGADLLSNSTGGNDIWVGGHEDDDDVAATTSIGTLNVDGVGSFIETEDLNVGIFGGNGTLNITNGGQVINTDGTSPDTQFGANDGFDGLKSSGTGLVDGDGSLLESRAILVGGSGMGRLDVRGGAVTRTVFESASLLGNFHIGFNAGSDGKVAVHGSGISNSLLDVDDNLIVGDAALGQLNIGRDLDDNEIGSGALQVDLDLIIGDDAGNNLDNKVVVSGASATANIGSDLTVGSEGNGTFEARNDATVTITTNLNVGLLSGSNGTVVVDGANTTLSAARLFNGNGTGSGSTGMMTVSGGATATFTAADDSAVGAVTLGDDDEGNGTLTVTGNGSLVETTNASGGWFIGGSPNELGGTGTANILAGGRGISAARVVLGHGSASNSGSSGTLIVDGAGSQFDANGDYILVGFVGLGNMDVTGGGVVNADNIFVADGTGSAGSQLDIIGVGSTVNLDGHIHVGDTVRGTLNVTNGGQLNVAMVDAGERLIIGSGGGADGSKMTIEGGGSRVDYFGTDRVSVGFSGGSVAMPAELEILNGGVLQAVQRNPDETIATQSQVVVADQTGSNGKLTVDGAGSRVEAQLLDVGEDGASNGTVEITGGGLIELLEFAEIGAGGSGDSTITVSGAGSMFDVGGDLSMGAASGGTASGTLNISDGGFVDTGDEGYVGRFTGNDGEANVGGGGAQATWEIETDLIIAGSGAAFADGNSQISGSGTLNVMANGMVTAKNTVVLKDRGVIELTGGEIAADDFLFHDSPNRTLSPTVNFTSGTIRYTAAKTLAAADFDVIFGGGSHVLTTGQHLAIDGIAGLATPLRLNGGTFSVGSITPANAANLDFDVGTFNLTGSSLTVGPGGQFGPTIVIDGDQTINVVDNGATVGATGSLNIIEGGFTSAATASTGLILVSNTTSVDFDSNNFGDGLTNNGTLVAIDSTIEGSVVNNGDIEIVGTVDFVDGLSLMAGGALGIDLNGLSNFDAISIGDDASLDGALNVEVAGFSLAAGNSFEILDISGTQSGTFAGLVDGGLVGNFGGVDLFIDYDGGDGNDVVLFALAASIPGDFTGDGVVNIADYTRWRDNEGAATDAPLNDNGDGVPGIDAGDYLVWKDNFGAPAAAVLRAGSTPAPVPEPATAFVLAAGMIPLEFMRRWRSSN